MDTISDPQNFTASTRARNVWQHVAEAWYKQQASKPDPDKFILEQILTHLAKLEEDAGNPTVAIAYWEQVKILMPQRELVPARIDELRQKQSLSQRPP